MTRATALLLTAVVVLGALAGSVAAATGASITAEPNDPGAESTYTVSITVEDNATGSLNGLKVDLANADADVSDVGAGNVQTVGIDRDDDASGDTVDASVGDDLDSVKASNNGETVNFRFGGSYSLDAGDEVVIVFSNVTNPDSAGTYDVPVDVNPQSSGGEDSTSLTIGDGTGDDTATDTADPDDATDEEDTATTGDGDSGGDGGSGVTGPGFGVAGTLAALLGSAFLLRRR